MYSGGLLSIIYELFQRNGVHMRILAIAFGILSPLFSLTLIILTFVCIQRKKNTKKTYKSVRMSEQGEGDVTNELQKEMTS